MKIRKTYKYIVQMELRNEDIGYKEEFIFTEIFKTPMPLVGSCRFDCLWDDMVNSLQFQHDLSEDLRGRIISITPL